MQFRVHALQIRKRNLFLQDHLVETHDKVRIQESSVEDTQTQATTDKLEIVQVFGVDARCRVDLERIIVVGRVFEEAVEWVKHLMREEEEELSARQIFRKAREPDERRKTNRESPP